MLNEHEKLIWLAGWLEGEGYFGFSYDKNNGTTPRFVVSACSKDKDVLEKVKAIAGGNIYYRQSQDIHEWQVCSREEALKLMELVQPLMGSRRGTDISLALKFAEQNPRRYRKAGTVPHGTVHSYLKYGCRCDECKLARKVYYARP